MWTHAIITVSGDMVELKEPQTASLSVVAGASAIAKDTIDAWIVTHGDLDAVCTHFGWTNMTGENPSS